MFLEEFFLKFVQKFYKDCFCNFYNDSLSNFSNSSFRISCMSSIKNYTLDLFLNLFYIPSEILNRIALRISQNKKKKHLKKFSKGNGMNSSQNFFIIFFPKCPSKIPFTNFSKTSPKIYSVIISSVAPQIS